jgi:hypothetical protein
MAPFSKRYLQVWSTEYESASDAEIEGKLVRVELAVGQTIGSKELALAINCLVAAAIALNSPWEVEWALYTQGGRRLDGGTAQAGAGISNTIN